MTNAIENIHFGIELETTIPTNCDVTIGRYHGGLPVAWLPAGWKAERDGSISTSRIGHQGCEFVSPKLKGSAGIAEACKAAEAIDARGGRVNKTCGMHVTVEWTGDAKALARLITLVANHEKGLYASTGTHTRESAPHRGGASWCKGLKQYGDRNRAEQLAKSDRYHALNLNHLAYGSNRIEFRLFAGTLNPVKVAAAIQLCLALVELALNSKRCQSWDYDYNPAKPGPWGGQERGEGEREMRRLFYRLGWIKGHQSKRHGLEVIDGMPTMKEIRKELTRLAKKYDSES